MITHVHAYVSVSVSFCLSLSLSLSLSPSVSFAICFLSLSPSCSLSVGAFACAREVEKALEKVQSDAAAELQATSPAKSRQAVSKLFVFFGGGFLELQVALSGGAVCLG